MQIYRGGKALLATSSLTSAFSLNTVCKEFPIMANNMRPIHPGETLREEMEELNLSARQLTLSAFEWF
jgi:hypothetical protein